MNNQSIRKKSKNKVISMRKQKSKWRSPSCSCPISSILLISAVASMCFFNLKAPFRSRDVLPVLPHEVSWRILKALSNPADLLPTFVGATSAVNTSLRWKGSCFYESSASMEFHNKSNTEFGGGTLHMKLTKAHSWTCMDLYVFATPYRVTWDYYFFSGEHTLDLKEWEGKAELQYVKEVGVSIFLMEAGMLGTLKALWDVFPFFSSSGWGESANIGFLKKHMKVSFEPRPQPWVANVSVDDIRSGDLLAISKIRGRWGGFETLEKWVTGAFAGHTAVCLKDSHGRLWVGESGYQNDKGEDIIAIVPWEEWWKFEVEKDDSNPHIALLPLSRDVRAKFNETAAWEYARSMSGKPYGYHNMLFSWIDTVDSNYPPPLNAHLVASVMTVWSQMQPDYATNIWNEALNKRLGTEGLSLPEVLVEAERGGSSFDELLTIPEQDDWVYSDGKSLSCVAFVLEMYKAAGLFDPSSGPVQVTEFTIKDAYRLRFFEEGDFWQIKGKYKMELPQYNSMGVYPHMNERCPSLPPDYWRPPAC